MLMLRHFHYLLYFQYLIRKVETVYARLPGLPIWRCFHRLKRKLELKNKSTKSCRCFMSSDLIATLAHMPYEWHYQERTNYAPKNETQGTRDVIGGGD
jgi:hypothetical protein